MNERKISNSMKWSTAGEALAKLIAPITNMILARILVPEDFGIVATVNMIITFVELFADSGFAKYIIQSDFKDERELKEYASVAFWTNLSISILLWGGIYLLRRPVAKIVGNEGYENVIVIAASQLVIISLSSIQTALFRREFDFKTLFFSRIIMSVAPLAITIPLAFYFRNFWSLIYGSICQQLFSALFLLFRSSWKPKLAFSFSKLRRMLSYSLWSMAEAIAYWLTTWYDVLIMGSFFSAYYLGIYKNSLNMVNSLMQLVKASVIPVLFSSLSRAKDDQIEFNITYNSFQRLAGSVVIPLGAGVFMFRELATSILLGNQWTEAANIIGSYALSASGMLVFVSFYGEALKAKGVPKLFFLFEILSLLLIIPACLYIRLFGFWPFVYFRSASVLIQIILGFFFVKKAAGLSAKEMLENILAPLICTILMLIVGQILRHYFTETVWQFLIIGICIFVYFLAYRIMFSKKLTMLLLFIKKK